MRSRKLRWVLWRTVVQAGVVGFALSLSSIPKPSRITVSSGDRIHRGMTRVETEAILGPPGDYRTRPTNDAWFVGLPSTRGGVSWTAEWYSDEARVSVLVDIAGRVERMECLQQQLVHDDPLGNVRWHLRRLRHRWFP